MLEIIHDLAPGADLYFSSGIGGALAMMDAIDWLVSQSVDVIVDDLGFYDEHFFSDTAIAQAVADAASAGTVYVSAAGNDAELHYQGQWSPASNGLHDFDDTAGEDTVLNIGTVPNGGIVNIFLQWSDDWTASSNDYDLGLWDTLAGGYVEVSTNDQSVTHQPFEHIRWTNNTGAAVTVGGVIIPFGSPASRELEVFVYAENYALSSLADSHRTQTDSVFGHPAVAAAISVAAINAGDAGNDSVASYSSKGSSTIYTDFVNQSSTSRRTIDGAGIDGVETRIGQLTDSQGVPYFVNPFFGTSAAAPHVAAIAALVLDANPTLTPTQVSAILQTTAVDIGSTGYDDESGYGRFDAIDAVYKTFNPPTAIDVTASGDTGVASNDNITNDTTPSFHGINIPADSYVRVYADGSEITQEQQTGGSTEFFATSLVSLANGTYDITFRVGEDVNTPFEDLSNPSPPLTITIDTVAPKVTKITIAGSASIHADYPVPVGSGSQILSVPIGGADTIRVEVDENVGTGIDGNDFSLVSDIDSTSYPLAISGGFSYDSVTRTATFLLEDAFNGTGGSADPQPAFDQVVLTIADTATDLAGNALDGEWTNPTDIAQSSSSTFPSGNDSPGGDFAFYLTFMPGDHNFSAGSLQNKIDQGDQDAVLLNWGDTNQSFKNGDGTGEGTVDQPDLDQVLLNPGLDFQTWPSGGGLQRFGGDGSELTTSTEWTTERRSTALEILDEAFTRLDMEEVWDSLNVNKKELLESDTAWAEFRDDLASALDAYYGVSTV